MKLAFEEAARKIPIVARCRGLMAGEGRAILASTAIHVSATGKTCALAAGVHTVGCIENIPQALLAPDL